MKNVVAIGAAAFLGLIAVFAVKKYVEDQEASFRGAQVMVLTVNRDMDQNDEVRKDDLDQKLVASPPPDAYTPEDANAIIGATTALKISAGTTLQPSMFRQEERHFAKDMIDPGKRAITIPVGGDSGFAGMLLPGDVVDILITYTPGDTLAGTLAGGEAEEIKKIGKKRIITTLMMPNIVLVALDNRTTRGVYNPEGSDFSSKTYSSATLMVSPQEAQMLIFAQQASGVKMTFVLRNPDDRGKTQLTDLDEEWFPELMKEIQTQRNK